MKALFDTNILIDALNGNCDARATFDTMTDAAISVISAFEVLSGTSSWDEERAQGLVARFRQVDVDPDIVAVAVLLAKERKLPMPDALIVATAQVTGRTLFTRDAKLMNEFEDPPVVVPYEV